MEDSLSAVEEINADGTTLAFLFQGGARPDQTTFLTPHSADLQVGFIVKGQNDDVPRHEHELVERRLRGTSEVLVVQSGRCELDLFDTSHELVATRELSAGDIVVLLAGGHGIRMIEPTVFLEVKQGPYPGVDEKRAF